MPRFRFSALDARGETFKGTIDAADQTAVVEQLRKRQQIPTAILPEGQPVDEKTSSRLVQWFNRPGLGKGVRRRDVALMTREFATLLNAGLTVDEALSFLVNISLSQVQRRLIADILEKVQGGSTLADALGHHTAIFSPAYIGLVRAGEAGNALHDVLARLAHFLDRSEQLTEQVKSALVYPVALMFMAIVSIIVLLVFVVPQFTPLFESVGTELPTLTQALVSFGDLAKNYWWVGLFVGVGLALLAKAQFRDPVSRAHIDRVALKLPLIGDLITKIETARLAHTVGTLLANGVALPHALAIAQDTLSNALLRDQLGTTLKAVKEGRRVSSSLERAGSFPKLAIHLIAVGEHSGQLETMMLKVAEIFDQDVKITIERLMALLVPVLTIGIGLIVAGIIGALLTAILGVYQLPI